MSDILRRRHTTALPTTTLDNGRDAKRDRRPATAWHDPRGAHLDVPAVATNAEMLDLEQALASHLRIGAAIRVVMARHAVTEEAAFARLTDASQRRDCRLLCIADEILLTGEA